MLINKYYDSSEQEEKKNEYYIQELQKYIHEKNISSKDADQLNRWVEQQKVLHVRVYKGDIVVFESEYPEQKLWEEEIPANEYEWMDYYPIEFADGSAQVNIWGIYDYQFYHYAMIVEVLFSFLLFLLLFEYSKVNIFFFLFRQTSNFIITLQNIRSFFHKSNSQKTPV